MRTYPAVIGYLHVMKNITVAFECGAVLSAGGKKLKVTLIVLETAVLNANSITRILIIESVEHTQILFEYRCSRLSEYRDYKPTLTA